MDPITAWHEAYERVISLVADISPEALEVRVPACPAWTARDLLSHMIGLAADVLDGDEPDDHHSEWTQRQVEARLGRAPSELLSEWAALAGPLVTWMGEHGARPLGDVVIHEQDLRGALGAPGGRDSAGFALIRERMADRLGGRVGGLPPLALVGEDWSWCSAGASSDAAVVVRASGFDLGRALMSRRTADQLRGWTVSGDVTAYLDAFAGLGPLPDRPLPE